MDNSTYMELALKTNNLTKKLSDKFVLNNINLEVFKGQMINIVGDEASGKSSLITLLTGIEKADFGTCQFFLSRDIKNAVGICLGDVGFFPELSAEQNFNFFASLYGLSEEEVIIDKQSYLFHKLNLWDSRNKTLGQLTTSEVAKLQFARSLISEPDLLIIDDIIEKCDNETTQLIYEILLEFQKQGKTILLFSRNPVEQILIDRYSVLVNGELVCEGNAEELRVITGIKYPFSVKLKNTMPGNIINDYQAMEDEYIFLVDSTDESASIITSIVSNGGIVYEAKTKKVGMKSIINKIYNMFEKKEDD